jgi:hypothetical protein
MAIDLSVDFCLKGADLQCQLIRIRFTKREFDNFSRVYPPDLRQIATILKTNTRILRDLFPNLCDQLKECRAEYRRSITESNTIQAQNFLEKILQEKNLHPL